MMSANLYLPGTIYIPSNLLIQDISRSFPMEITASIDSITSANSYREGQLVKLTVPYPYGMFQANGRIGKILSVVGLVFTLDIDSTNFDAFTVPIGNVEQPASFSPAGSRNMEYSNSTNLVPFQTLNNIGN